MNKKYRFLFILAFTTAFSFYRTGSIVAMAADQITELAAGAEVADKSAADSELEADDGITVGSELEADDGITVGSEPEANNGSTTDSEPEAGNESAVDSETEADGGSAAETETGPEDEPGAETEPESGQNADHVIEHAEVQVMAASILPEKEESVSTGSALIEWLESHKDIGGTVRLADHVILDGEYSYCPSGSNMPAVYVDTGHYTITVSGEIEFVNDHHLVFSGQPDGKGIFYVAEKGMLSLQGVVVESETGALWQEEGAGLAVSGCRTAGSIHYAQTPFVIEPDPICVVVEKGQTVNDVLPEHLGCRVNWQGAVSSEEPLPLSWNLEGTERQQEERRRFQIQGFFLHAASVNPVQCTVVYNDYPLTFEEVHASVNGNCYIFKGWYTGPEEESQYTLISEYSFDAENWLVSNESTVEGTGEGFIIFVDKEQSGRTAHPYIYIRLQRNDNGIRYFSNVLCYAADNLDCVEDIGGSRGGGTSIVAPPNKPQEGTGDSSSEGERPTQKPAPDIHEENAKPEASATNKQTEKDKGASDSSDGKTAGAVPSGVDISESGAEPLLYAKAAESDAEPPLYAEAANADEEQPLYAGPPKNSGNLALYTYTEYAQPAAGGNKTFDRANYMAIAAGFVLLSAFAGAAGFYVHSYASRSGTKR